MEARELAVSGRHEKCHDKLSEHTKQLPALTVGDNVALQDCHGNDPLRWTKRGKVVSVEGYDKYGVKVLGSGRLTFRNRAHLKRYVPDVLEDIEGQTDLERENELQRVQGNEVKHLPVTGTQVCEKKYPDSDPEPQSEDDAEPVTTQATEVTTQATDVTTQATDEPVRRSARVTKGKTTKFSDYDTS